jgi:alpha/beta superfamily hydrolase
MDRDLSVTKIHESRNLFLEGPAGRLEAILWRPQGLSLPPMAGVICHPHPLFGGTMHNKVIYQTAKSLDALGLAVLRFNFRGAGRSEGTHDRGRSEQADVHAALDFLANEFPGVPLVLAGFSFGCWVGLRVGCEDARVAELIGLGAPVNNTDFSYLDRCAKPKLFVHGENDEHGDVRKVEALVARLPGENRFVMIPGVDHFFTGKLDQLDRATTMWLTDRHPDLNR